jgi:hypothetical protein
MEGSWKYTEKADADSQKGMVFQLEGLTWNYQSLTLKE